MSALNLAKTSTLMTATERAKMVITLQLKALKEVKDKNVSEDNLTNYNSPVLLAKDEIEQIANGCPNSQAAQYNLLIDIKKFVWDRLAEKIREDIIALEMLEKSVTITKYSLGLATYFYFLVHDLERIPKVVTKEEYDKGVERAREVERAQVLKMSGRYSLPEQEAYYRLISEGKIEDGELDGYLDYVDSFGKTEDRLVNEKVEDIKKGIEGYKKEKERLEGEEPSFNYYAKYLNLTDEEIKEKVKVSYKNSLYIPTKEEIDEWKKTVSDEKERILNAVNEGKLIAKDDGIEAGSYYDWSERHQKFAGEKGAEKRGWNPLAEDCMEIGYSDGKVMSSLEALDNHDWREIIITTLHNQGNIAVRKPEDVDVRVHGTIESLKMLLPIEVIDGDPKSHQRTIKITKEGYVESLRDFVKTASEKIVDILNNKALIIEIESDYFGGMELIGRTEDVPDFSLEHVDAYVKEFVSNHNKKIKGIVTSFNQLGGGFWDCHLEAIEELLIHEDLTIDKDWITKRLDNLQRDAGR